MQTQKFKFCIDKMVPIPGEPGHFTVMSVIVEGTSVEDAATTVDVPEGHKIFAWFTVG